MNTANLGKDIKSSIQSLKDTKEDIRQIDIEINYRLDRLDDSMNFHYQTEINSLLDRSNTLLGQIEKVLSLLN